MADPFPRRALPCGLCSCKRDTPPGQFPTIRFEVSEALAISRPMFGCHRGAPGTDEHLACVRWLAVAGSARRRCGWPWPPAGSSPKA